MMFERASPSLQSRKLLRAGGQGRAGNMLTGFMLTGFAGHPALASTGSMRSDVTTSLTGAMLLLVTQQPMKALGRSFVAPFHKYAAFMGEVFETSESI
jgi:hypothetical protein